MTENGTFATVDNHRKRRWIFQSTVNDRCPYVGIGLWLAACIVGVEGVWRTLDAVGSTPTSAHVSVTEVIDVKG